MTKQQQDMDRVRGHLELSKTLTKVQADELYGVTLLSATIADLRSTGMVINTSMGLDEQGTGYARYSIPKPFAVGDLVQIKRGHGYGLPTWVKLTKGERINGITDDVAYITFTRGNKQTTQPLNFKELVHV